MTFAAAKHQVVPEAQYSPQGLSSLLAGIWLWTL